MCTAVLVIYIDTETGLDGHPSPKKGFQQTRSFFLGMSDMIFMAIHIAPALKSRYYNEAPLHAVVTV